MRQVQSLSAIDGDDNGSDTYAHSYLDSFDGDDNGVITELACTP